MWPKSWTALLIAITAGVTQAAPLEQIGTVAMPGVRGRIDHLAVDIEGHRLFVAALGNDTVEVIDTAARRHLRTLAGFGEPQGLVYLAGPRRLFVASGSSGRVDILDGASLAPLERVAKLPDADNLRFDAATRRVIVGFGDGALRLMEADKPQSSTEIKLAAHPESFQLEESGSRIFVNVPDARQVAVVDRARGAVIATWDLPDARANFPMALDEAGKRLFVGARSPAQLLIYDTESGRVVSRNPIGGDTDDIFFDTDRKRVYVVCGAGRAEVFRQETVDRYVHEDSIKTAPRARTGLFVPEERRLYVAAPAAGGSPARVLIYEVR